MEPQQITPSPKRRTLLIVLVSIVLVGLSFGITFFILKSTSPQNASDTKTSQTTTPTTNASIDDVIAGYPSVPIATKTFQSVSSSTGMVYYQQKGAEYTIGIPTQKALSFASTDPSTRDATSQLQKQSTDFFSTKGYTLEANPDYSTASAVYTTYVNDSSVCQVGISVPAPKVAQTVALGCASKDDIAKEYTTMNTLIGLYTKSHPKPTFKTASRNLVTSGNKSLSIVRLTGGSTEPALLFAAIDNNWEYLATLSNGSSSSSNGKYVSSPEVTAALNNPKYGDFIKNNI